MRRKGRFLKYLFIARAEPTVEARGLQSVHEGNKLFARVALVITWMFPK